MDEIKQKVRHRIKKFHMLSNEQIEQFLGPYVKGVNVSGIGRGRQINLDPKDGYKIEIQNMDILVSTNL